jgi:hypothetical protein
MSDARYLYGLIGATEEGDFGAIGVPLRDQPARVYSVVEEGVGAVVSEYAGPDKVRPLRKNLAPHHTVIRQVMETTTMVPMTFGHIAGSEEELRQMLRLNREAVLAELERLGGKVEMGLKVKWDVENIFEYILERDRALARFRDQIFGRSTVPCQAEKIELGRMFDERVNQEREEQAEVVAQMLGSVSAAVRVNPPKGERMVMDLAFLVDQRGVEAFESALRQIAGRFPEQYTFDYSGPWAPFNFVEIDLRSVDAT